MVVEFVEDEHPHASPTIAQATQARFSIMSSSAIATGPPYHHQDPQHTGQRNRKRKGKKGIDRAHPQRANHKNLPVFPSSC
jgi:hypothetical protein